MNSTAITPHSFYEFEGRERERENKKKRGSM
jgi:hypothetical protein